MQFSYNPSKIIKKLPLEIKELIFDNVINHLTYPASSDDIEWRVWTLIDNIYLKPAGKCGEKFLHYGLFNPHPNIDQIYKFIFQLHLYFHHVIDEDTN